MVFYAGSIAQLV